MSPKPSDDPIDPASEAGSPRRAEPESSAPPEGVRADPADSETSRNGGPAEAAPAVESGAEAARDAEREPRSDASDAPEQPADELEREMAHLNDRHLRLAAEFENYRKRVRTEKRETWARAQADLVRRLVESIDDLQRVALLDPGTASVRDIVDGVDLVERKLLRALADAGLEVLDPVDEDFDPRNMEAVMTAPASSEDEDETVDQVLQRGYLLQGHLVRPARVSVRKHD